MLETELSVAREHAEHKEKQNIGLEMYKLEYAEIQEKIKNL